ncbi:unnamed protein product [Ostreobium quekettii]|uniref:Uncharacterized protein n=1 Tax=Ostreobium quekettii TaxID=121088 RepID=A0A8S1ISL0_9CHLO|nr:unnamed protein product [Ostreobium quekettii]|eukprot:evm.model.scf_494EXC.2 EVM.evm.TU.scf_494EXC.2   scf_494EXC:32584-33244(-)
MGMRSVLEMVATSVEALEERHSQGDSGGRVAEAEEGKGRLGMGGPDGGASCRVGGPGSVQIEDLVQAFCHPDVLLKAAQVLLESRSRSSRLRRTMRDSCRDTAHRSST